jgi:Ca2+/H+ antiporter, TMEM165/GDT1 family
VDAFWQSAFLIAVAEMGDKSQLAALAIATRFSARLTLRGIFVATLLVHLVSVIIGELLGVALPTFWIRLVAGLAFLGFGLWTLRGDSFEDDAPRASRLGAFLSISLTFFLAELGDKTMLATITLGSQLNDFIGVWLVSTVGLVAAYAVAMVVGIVLGKRLPARAIQLTAALIFFGFGLLILGEALNSLRP